MAKCIEFKPGWPARMSDEDAFQIVEREHKAQYCPKHVWRQNESRRVMEVGTSGRIVDTPSLQQHNQHKRGSNEW
jgi:hypothetical protein